MSNWPRALIAPMILAYLLVVGGLTEYDRSHIRAGVLVWLGLVSATYALIAQARRDDREQEGGK